MSMKTVKILSEHEVKNMTGLSTTTRWRLERCGQFPQKVRLSANRVGWIEGEIREWLENAQRERYHD